ncbi:MAG: hypothetical protein GX160_01045 [Clostridiales bacterium]|nr:hypothetical protein [Clostridiales bacterium]
MDCKNFNEYISLYLDEILDEEDKKEFEEHLNQCPQCKKEFEETQKVVSLVKELGEEPVPHGFRESIINRLGRLRKNQTSNLIRWIAAMAGVIIIFLSVKAIKDTRFTAGIDREVMPAEEVAEDMASISDDSVNEFASPKDEGVSAEVTSMEDDQGDKRASTMKVQSDLVEVYVQDICITPQTLKLMANSNGLDLIKSDENSVVIEIKEEKERNILYEELSKMGEIRDIGENIGGNEVKIIIKTKNE